MSALLSICGPSLQDASQRLAPPGPALSVFLCILLRPAPAQLARQAGALTPEADVFLVLFLWNVVEKYVLCDCPSAVKSPVSQQSLLAADLFYRCFFPVTCVSQVIGNGSLDSHHTYHRQETVDDELLSTSGW